MDNIIFLQKEISIKKAPNRVAGWIDDNSISANKDGRLYVYSEQIMYPTKSKYNSTCIIKRKSKPYIIARDDPHIKQYDHFPFHNKFDKYFWLYIDRSIEKNYYISKEPRSKL